MIRKKSCLRLHYNGANSYLFANDTEIHKFKAKDSEINPIPLCLGNIFKNFSGFYGYFYNCSVDYGAIATDEILDIHKCLMKKDNRI